MLQRLVQAAVGRQAIRKGYALAGGRTIDRAAVEAIAERYRRAGAGPALLVAPVGATVVPVHLDTGLRWLCTRGERARLRAELAAATRTLAGAAAGEGLALLGCAGLPAGDLRGAVAVGDEHHLEVHDDVDRALVADALRAASPLLIALAARSQPGASGSGAVASARLHRESGLGPPPLVRSGGSEHLGHLARQLRRQGVRSFAQLDVDPGGGDPGTVVVRALDGQSLADTTCAHALVLAALAASARQAIQAPAPRWSPNRKTLAMARERAVVHGLNARFERLGPGGGAGPINAASAVLGLVESLGWELRCLDVAFDELAPVALGLGLRGLGWPAFRSENDAFGRLLRQSPSSVEGVVAAQSLLGHGSLGALNAATFPDAAPLVRFAWGDRLGEPRSVVSPARMLLAVLIDRSASWEDRRGALLGLHRETFCFDLQGLAERTFPGGTPPLFDLLTAPVKYRRDETIDRSQVERYVEVVRSRRVMSLDVDARTRGGADETEAQLFAEPLRGVLPFRVGRRGHGQGPVTSRYLLVDEGGP